MRTDGSHRGPRTKCSVLGVRVINWMNEKNGLIEKSDRQMKYTIQELEAFSVIGQEVELTNYQKWKEKMENYFIFARFLKGMLFQTALSIKKYNLINILL